jgi:hypothetical protein
MSFIAIAIWVLIIIGAFMIHPILGLIVLLGSIFMLLGGLDKKTPEVYPHTLNEAQLDKYKKDSETKLYRWIYTLLNMGKNDREIASDKKTKEYAKSAGVTFSGVQSVKAMKTSKAFLVQNGLYDKYTHLVISGSSDKDIAKNLIKRWAVFGSAYSKHDVALMRESL